MWPLLQPIISQILIPEIIAVIRAHQNASNGQMPTDAQVLAALALDAARVQAIGQAFLDQTKPPV